MIVDGILVSSLHYLKISQTFCFSDPSDGTFVKSFNLLETKITRICFNVIKLHEELRYKN